MTQVLRNQNIDVEEKKRVITKVFKQYDQKDVGELTPVQVQILHGDMRIGGISFPQVLASMKYVCATNKCHVTELYDLLQEMDRRYFLLQDLRWEFSFLDRAQIQTITVEQAKWMMQSVHGRYFSPGRWANFIKSRQIPKGGVAFAEIEVMLCDIPSKQSLEEEQKEKERLMQERLRMQEEQEAAMRMEQKRRKEERQQQRKKMEEEREREEEELRKRERAEDDRKRQEEEDKLRLEKEEEERLRQMQEEERRRQEEEEALYQDVEQHHKDAEDAEKDADSGLSRIGKEKEGADEKKRKHLEEEEERLRILKRDSRNKRLRYQLKVAIKKKDKYQLEYSITEFTKAKLSDDDMDLEKAKRLLKQFAAKDGLAKAMTKREISDLEKAMAFVRKHGFEAELAREMIAAKQLLTRLQRLERIRHEILELKQATVAEIRSYQNPPVIVHKVMTATFLLLGHKERETKDWKAVQALVGKTGKESLKRRCLELDATKVALATAKQTNKLLEKYELDEVRDISAGAATFFVWATAIVEEAFSQEAETSEKAEAERQQAIEAQPEETDTDMKPVE